MNWKRIAITLAALALLVVPAHAGSFALYGSYWDSNDADSSKGYGARAGFSFAKHLELDFHGTYYPSFTADVQGQMVEVKAKPIDGGLRVNLLPGGPINPYVGAGVSYFFLDTAQGEIDDQTGIYGQAGLEFGGGGVPLLKIDTTITLASFDRDTQLDGLAANAGFCWRWGK